MLTTITFTVPGPVRGKGRPRFVRQTGRTYTDAETVAYENLIKEAARQAMGGRELLDGAVAIILRAVYQPPQSISAKKRAAMLSGDVRPTIKPDIDNILKTLDALNGIVWRDDKQVVQASISKVYAATPGLEVLVREVLA